MVISFHLKDSLKKVINLIHESNWFELPCNDTQILGIIQNQVNILILPMDFAPQRKTEPKISGHDAGLIVSYLVRHSKTDIQQNEKLIMQIIEAIPKQAKQEMIIFREYTKDLKFVSVFNCHSNISEVSTPSNLVNLQQQGLLFLNLSDSRKIAAALQAALKNKTIILVNNAIANNLLEEEIRGCNRSACLSLIKQKPELSNIEDRAKLLEELL